MEDPSGFEIVKEKLLLFLLDEVVAIRVVAALDKIKSLQQRRISPVEKIGL